MRAPTKAELRAAAVEWTHGAGGVLRASFGKARAVEHKSSVIDIVTEADKASERFLISAIAERFPTHGVLAEESGAHSGEAEYRWVIDPLDGTINFAHGQPHFCVTVAAQVRVASDYRTEVGVTYDPMRAEMFVAVRGEGAWLNDTPLCVSDTAELIHSSLATGFHYRRLMEPPDNHAEFCRMNLLTRGVRRYGAAALDLAYVAAGRLDGYWEYALKPWDVAAGALLVEEAGGRVTTMDGAPFALAAPGYIASNGTLHEVVLRALISAKGAPINSRRGLAPFLPADVAAQLERALEHGDVDA